MMRSSKLNDGLADVHAVRRFNKRLSDGALSNRLRQLSTVENDRRTRSSGVGRHGLVDRKCRICCHVEDM